MRAITPVSVIILTTLTIFVSACGSQSDPIGAIEPSPEQRITPLNRDLILDSGQHKISEDDPALKFTYIASTSAPLDPESKTRFQATNFAPTESFVVVTYAMAGSATRGAIDLIDINDIKAPKILSTIFLKDMEFADVATDEKYGYFVGAGLNGALLHIRTLPKSGKSEDVASLELPGYYATDIQIVENAAWITAGNNAGLMKVDIQDPKKPVLLEFYSLENAVSSLSADHRVFVLAGESKSSIFELLDSKFYESASVSDQPPQAPGRMAFEDEILATNAGVSGLSVFDAEKKTLKLLHHRDLPGTGNSIALHSKFAFLAQGEAGLHVMDLYYPSTPSYLGKFDFSDDSGSANQVRVCLSGSNPLVFVADGLGGFRILNFTFGIELGARKSYTPSEALNDTRNLAGPVSYVVPKEIPVVTGNAGNQKSFLYFDKTVCSYQGGSTMLDPVGEKEISLGKVYKFVSCSNGVKAGQKISASTRVQLEVESGAPSFGSTQVKLSLRVVL